MSNLFVQSSSLTSTTTVLTPEGVGTMFNGMSIDLTNDQVVTALGLVRVSDPNNTQTENTVLVANVDQSGNWTSSWISSADYTVILNNQINENTARFRRDQLLSKSDWTQTVDNPLSTEKKAAWATYRQSLRDITNQEHFPTAINWPREPR